GALGAHVVFAPGPDLSEPEPELARRVSERCSERLSFSRSPWAMELLPLEGGRSALLFRVHHCIADGRSLVRLLCDIADPPRPELPGRARPSRAHAADLRPSLQGVAHKARELGS